MSGCDGGGITFDEIEDRAKLYDSCDSSSICAETYYFGGFFLWIVDSACLDSDIDNENTTNHTFFRKCSEQRRLLAFIASPFNCLSQRPEIIVQISNRKYWIIDENSSDISQSKISTRLI